MMKWAACAAVLLLGSLAWASSQEQELVAARLLADTKAIVPGRPFRVGVLLKIAPQWHVYWVNPGEAGIATTVDLHLPAGFKSSAVMYPLPARFESPGRIVSFGYSDEVMLMATITPPADIASSSVAIEAEADWLVCKETCIPGHASLKIALPVNSFPEPDHQELFQMWSDRLPLPIVQSEDVAGCTWQVSSDRVSMVIQWRPQTPTEVECFPLPHDSVLIKDLNVQTHQGTTRVTARIEAMSAGKKAVRPLEILLAYNLQSRRGVIVSIDVNSGERQVE